MAVSVRSAPNGASAAPFLRIRGLSKRFGQFTALNDISLDVKQGDFVCFLGPSGCGKTTLLRAIAGLDPQDEGLIEMAGCDVSRLPPAARDFGIVFQSYALFPNLSVAANVGYGLVNRRAGKAEMNARVAELLALVGLPEQGQKYPVQLSGGQQQRVALARALATSPGLMLLDEPLSALDTHTKDTVRLELQELLRTFDLPTLIVTHDYEDAAALAGTLGVLVEGELRQLGSPAELVSQPNDPFVASFTGANLLRGRVQSHNDGLTGVQLESGEVVYSTDTAQGDVGVVVYPWDVSIGRIHTDDSALNLVHGEIASVSRVGNRVRVRVGPLTAEVTAASAERLELARGGVVIASFKATGTRLVPLAR